MSLTKPYWIFCFAVLLLNACKTKGGDNSLSKEEQQQGWILLFNGNDARGWHLYNKQNTNSGWIVKDGALMVDTVNKTEVNDLVSDQSFKNFDLQFDWRLTKGGNSGVFINVLERPDITTAWASGPEYQLLDPAHADYEKPAKKAGALYAMVPQQNGATTKTAGEWNHSRIKQQDGKVEFYLNGVLTATQDFTTQAWKDSVANSHFSKFPEFGKNTSGHIALQDWASGVAFKNIKIKKLQ